MSRAARCPDRTCVFYLAGVCLLITSLAACSPDPTPEQRARVDSLRALPAMERLPDGRAGELVRRAIEAHGGWEAWTELSTIVYRKITVDLDRSGTPTDSAVARHRYALHPGPMVHIERTGDDGRPVTLINDGDEAWRLVDGDVDDGILPGSPARAPTFGSHFVFCQPFKLADAGARYTHLGRDTLADGTPVEGLRVRYLPGVGDSGGEHTWEYYFDPATGRLAGYRFGQGDEVDRGSLTRYGDFREVAGVLLYGSRTAYEVTEDSVRATRVYRHEDHRANVPLPDSLFTPPG